MLSPSTEIDESPWGAGTAETLAPWLFDANGTPLRLPAHAVGFRVRYWPGGAHGIGDLLRGPDGGPLFLSRSCTPDEFRARTGGRPGTYKLATIDEGFGYLKTIPLGVVVIAASSVTERASAPTETPAASPNAELIGQVLSFVREANATALAQIATVQRDLAELQRETSARLGQVVSAVAGVLSAAGASGVVKKTLTLDAAAAGAPVTVQMMPANGNDAPSTATPRNAAGSTAATTAAAAASATEKGGAVEAALSLFVPLIEKGAPVAAYGLAQKLGLPDHVARDLAGVAQTTVQTASQMLRAGDAATEAASEAGAFSTVPAAELGAHVMRIQLGLPEDDRAWVGSLMAKCPGLIEALKPAVAAVTVDEGIAAVRTLRAVDAALSTANERRLFGEMLKPSVLPTVFRAVLVERTTDEAIGFMREQAAAMVG